MILLSERTAPIVITTEHGDHITVSLDIYRDTETNEIAAADPKVRREDGRRLDHFIAWLRKRKTRATRKDERMMVTY